MTTSASAAAAPSPSLRLLRAPFEPRTWRETLHLLLNLPVGVTTFSLMVAGFSAGIGLLITLLGVPVLALTLIVSRGLATFERARAAALLGAELRPPYRPDPAGRWWTILAARLRDPATWLSVVYDLVLFPVGIFTFVVAVTCWTTALSATLLPLYDWALPDMQTWMHGSWHIIDAPGEVAVVSLVGVLLVLFTPWLIRAMGAANRMIVTGLLGGADGELSHRLERVTASRDAAVDVAASDRRRIERDLHDGVQQRLVALAMDLGRAREKMESDPEAARTLVAGAHDEAKRAIADVRSVARGVYPAVLTDLGLDPALSSLAARSPVPVDVAVDVAVRPPASVEAAAYFVVSEALANVAKHARATRASVTVRRSDDGWLTIQVQDDGVGGADLAKGTGLAGLRDRVQAIDGELHLLSPVGGPTVLMVELPCAS